MKMASSSSWLPVLFKVYLLFTLMNFVSSSINESPILHLSVSPNAGSSPSNIAVRCEITPPSNISPLSSTKFDNIYLSVQTDSVRPSGILLKFDDTTDSCHAIPEKKFQMEVCNASLILIHISHTIVNDTLQKIDYVCSKGNTYVHSSYRLIKDHSARYYDPMFNSSSLTRTSIFLVFILACRTTMRWL